MTTRKSVLPACLCLALAALLIVVSVSLVQAQSCGGSGSGSGDHHSNMMGSSQGGYSYPQGPPNDQRLDDYFNAPYYPAAPNAATPYAGDAAQGSSTGTGGHNHTH